MDREMEIPRPSLARLPIYYRRLLRALEDDEAVISSQALGEAAGVPAAQVRKDLSHLGEMGRAGIGYDTGELAVALQDFLGLGNDKEAVLAGAGHLGQALAAYPGFERYGLRILALFDVDPSRIGREVSGKPVYALDQLAPVVRRHGVRMGILCVPADGAQEVADLMVSAGIEVIWNFAPRALQVPPQVLLQNEDLASRLATISYYITRKQVAARELAHGEGPSA